MENNNQDTRFWNLSLDELYKELASSKNGLSSIEADSRLKKFGYNEITKEKRESAISIFIRQFKNPLLWILIFCTILSYFTGDHLEAILILSMIVLYSLLGFFQEYKTAKTFELLKQYTKSKNKVIRDNKTIEIDSEQIIPGDIVYLTLGDMVPADIRIIQLKDLTVDESSLTGESMPVEKKIILENNNISEPNEASHMLLMGTSILSGECYGVVTITGDQTYFGKIAQILQKKETITDFEKNVTKFSKLMIKIILIMTFFVFLVNTIQHKNFLESVLFALALAVGITPELLPIILTITLARGARKMAAKKVIVKQLSSIENLGNMDTLCSDKTGTLTEGVFSLDKFIDINDNENTDLLVQSLLCSQSIFKTEKTFFNNPMDKCLWEKAKEKNLITELDKYQVIDLSEFNFKKRRINCIIEKNSEKTFLTKGSPDNILPLCKLTQEETTKVKEQIDNYEKDGYRVIVLAGKKTDATTITDDLERDLNFLGYLIFIDPPKEGVKESLEKLNKLKVNIKIITGDSPLITKKVCTDLNIKIIEDRIITGNEVDEISDEKAFEIFSKYNVFARINPEQKYRIVKVLNSNEHIVGYLGDGVNDTPALKISDVGISVSSAVEIAKDAAQVVLLEKSLNVLTDGIIEGRKAFGNCTKYILNSISSNLGNMITIEIFSFFLPFIPQLPSQILLANLISDVALTGMATDNVDKELLVKPRKWDFKLIIRFMIIFGAISSIFDVILLLLLMNVYHVDVINFRSILFMFSLIAELLITFIIRTTHPFYKSKPGKSLIITSMIMLAFTIILPYITVVSKLFQLTPIPFNIILPMLVLLGFYCMTVEFSKKYFFKTF
ncbi:MAG: magnesium-translocating P-type ATPase [Candidatus Babeliales bacterium]|nr:magnesium-translocating P-type ATPase [Candidatus Babeliales bacterium]